MLLGSLGGSCSLVLGSEGVVGHSFLFPKATVEN